MTILGMVTSLTGVRRLWRSQIARAALTADEAFRWLLEEATPDPDCRRYRREGGQRQAPSL
jgi:hypothetical protein